MTYVWKFCFTEWLFKTSSHLVAFWRALKSFTDLPKTLDEKYTAQSAINIIEKEKKKTTNQPALMHFSVCCLPVRLRLQWSNQSALMLVGDFLAVVLYGRLHYSKCVMSRMRNRINRECSIKGSWWSTEVLIKEMLKYIN